MLKIRIIKKEYTLSDTDPLDGKLEYDYIDSYDEDFTLREFCNYLKKRGATWYSSSSYRPLGAYDWLTTEYQVNPYTEDWIELSLHCADTNDEKRWERYLAIADKLGLFMQTAIKL